MNIIEIINKKRLNIELNEQEIKYVIENYVNGNIKDYQMSALLMAICINDCTIDETFYLTKYMIQSGHTIDFSSIKGPIVDKHSTGGVGDKTTLIIAPLVASTGLNVAKMSGHGLGFTGGTADKLEGIPGYKTNLTEQQFLNQIKKINVAIVTQNEEIALADKKIYALRDVSGTVESIPLIASSIMSKKIATGADVIVIDVKVGIGALVKNVEDARKLSKIMVELGKKYNKKVICILTDMNIPLGLNIGNNLEVKEAIDVLNNIGEERLTELCITLSTYMVSQGLNISIEDAKKLVQAKLENKEAYNKFLTLVKTQGGNIDKLKESKYIYPVNSKINGFLTNIDAYKLGMYVASLGASRNNIESPIDYSVGITLNKKINEYVNTHDILFTIHSNKEITSFEEPLSAFEISSKKTSEKELIIEIIK